MKTIYTITAEELAERFHKVYERKAKKNMWKTQDKCKVKFKDLPEENKKTMIETCEHIIEWLAI